MNEQQLQQPKQQEEQNEQRQPQQEQQSILNAGLNFLLRLMIMYYVFNFFNKSFNVNSNSNGNSVQVSTCEWNEGEKYSFCLILSNSSSSTFNMHKCFRDDFTSADESLLLSSTTDYTFEYGKWDALVEKEMNVTIHNHLTPMYIHFYLFRNENSDFIVHKVHHLFRYYPKKKQAKVKNLISQESNQTIEDLSDHPVLVPYWYPNLTINIIPDSLSIPLVQIQSNPELLKLFSFSRQSKHLPLVYMNDFFTLKEDIYSNPINETTKVLPLYFRFSTLSMMKLQFMVQLEHSFRVQLDMMGSSEQEVDNIKRMLFETNPYLLALTFIVSLLHSVFDFLAFKNDINFWKEKKSFEGLSLRSVLLNLVFQVIIFLYLLDNETSWIILVSSFVGLLIEFWKIRKVIEVKHDAENGRSLLGLKFNYWLEIKNTSSSALSKETDEYDALAFKYLGFLCFPLVIGYAIYSLVYQQHKSWYSWTLNTAVGFVYTFGFIAMTPQLFINYKLKSVAHMPWKTFMYKALNTFIDDLFAFIIKMPTLHRLACFRDDLIFFIYLYQKWIYPVDKKRRNEFGQIGSDEKEEQLLSTVESDKSSAEEDKKTK